MAKTKIYGPNGKVKYASGKLLDAFLRLGYTTEPPKPRATAQPTPSRQQPARAQQAQQTAGQGGRSELRNVFGEENMAALQFGNRVPASRQPGSGVLKPETTRERFDRMLNEQRQFGTRAARRMQGRPTDAADYPYVERSGKKYRKMTGNRFSVGRDDVFVQDEQAQEVIDAYNEAYDERAQKMQKSRLAQAQERLHANNELIEELRKKRAAHAANVGGSTHFQFSSPGVSPMSTYGGNSAEQHEASSYSSAISQLERENEMLNAVIERKGVLGGMGDALFSADTALFGLPELSESLALRRIKDKIDRGEGLTEGERALFEAGSHKAAGESMYGDMLSNGYRWGQIAGYSVPFAAEMLLTGGGLTALRVGSRLATKGAAKIAAKGLAGNIGRGLVKGLGVTADEIGQSAILANTLGAGRTWADIERRNAGTPMGYDEQGNPVFVGSESRARSIWEGQGAATLERYSEKLGNHMGLLGDAAKWGGKKIAGSRGAQWLSGKVDELRGSRVGKMYSRMSNSDVAQAAKWLSNKMNFNGYIPEVLEEEANIVMNSLLVGDNQLSDLVDKETQLDIWGGMAVTSGFLGGANLAMGGLYSAANRAHRRNVKNQLHKADLVAGLRLTDDRWRGLRERIDNATFEETPLILSEVLASDEYATEDKRAVMQYAEALSKFRGLNLSENAIANGGGASPMDAEAYAHRLAGAEATADERANIRARSEAAAARVKAEFGISDSVDLEDWLKTYGETRGEQMQNLFPDEATPQDNADVKMVLDYINARETYEGMLEGVEDATVAAVLRSNMIVSDNTAPDGNIYMGTTRGGNPVYVVSGMPDGATTVVVRDAATGEIQQLPASDVEMNGQIMNGEEFRAREEARIREEAAAAADASILGAPMFNDGDVYEGIDESGQTYTLTINQNFGDGTAEITHSDYGTQRVKLDALGDLQADMDRARAVRMSMEEEAEEAAEGTSVAAPAAQANTPAHRQGDMVEARMPGGTVRGEIFEVSDEDGAPVYSVQWESPVQGVMVGRYSGEELSALQPAAEPENVAAELRSSEETDENDGRVEVHIIDPRDMSDEERAKRGDWLRDAPAIDVEEGTIVSTSELSARKAAEKWWMENVPEPVFYDTEAGEVEISKKSIENSLAHRYGQPKLDAITSLVEGFENAVYLGTMQDGTRDGNVQNHYFAYPINYKGERCYVFCRAMQDANKNRLYVREVFIAENIKKGDTLQTAASQPHGGIALYRDILANVLDASTSSASKDTPQSVSVQENEQKTLQPIPTRTTKKGTEVLYHEVPVARTLEELYDGTLTQPEVDAFVAANVDESRKQAEKTESTPPKMGTDLAAYKQAKAEWQAKVNEARRKADYWLEVQAEVQRITSRQNESASRSIESASRSIERASRFTEMPTSMSEAQDGAEYAAMAFAGKMGLRITPESFRGETGLGSAEQRQLTGVIATAENGGITIEQAAEWLYAAQENDGVSFYADETEARDAIIEVLSQGNPKGYVARSRKEAAKRDSQAEAADKEAWAQQHFHMSFEEYQAMEEQAIPAIIEQYRGFDESTYYANLADNYEQQNERRNDTEKDSAADSAAESAGIGRSGELLQGEQPASTGGTRHIGDGQQGRAAASDVQGGVSAEDASGTSGGGKPDNVRRLETRREQIAEAPTIGEQIQAAEAEVNTNPTEAQKEAGNYKKGHVQIGTFNVTIEQPKGSVRSGVDADGKKWETEMQNTYGYIRGTEGVDGDHIDVFLANDMDAWNGEGVFVVDQYNEDDTFDEHKVMLGFNSIEEAQTAYLNNYEDGWAENHKIVITGTNVADFEKWINSSHRKTKAFAEYKSVKTTEGQSASAERRNLAEAPVKAETPTISQKSEQVSDQDNAPYNAEEARRQPLRERAKEWEAKTGVKVHLIEDLSEVHNKAALAALEAGEEITGWYGRRTGEVYIYLPNVQNESDIDATYVHEVVAHKGMRSLLSAEGYDKLCDRVWNAMSEDARREYTNYPGVESIADEAKRRRAAADEYIAHLAEKVNLTDAEQTVWQQVVQFFREALEALGINVMVSDAQLSELIRASYAKMAQERKTETEANEQGEAGISFRKKKKSLVGLHNISENKLAKAIKQGGLANPSFAVVDIDVQGHEGYGDITLVMPSSLVDGADVYTGDAWSPTYPPISLRVDESGWGVIDKRLGEIEDDTLRHFIRSSVRNYLDDGGNARLEYVFLKEKGHDAPIEYKAAKGMIGIRGLEVDLGVSDLLQGETSYEAYLAAKPAAKRSFNMWRLVNGNAAERKKLIAQLRENRSLNEELGLTEDLAFGDFDSFVHQIKAAQDAEGSVDEFDTTRAASEKVDALGLREEYKAWLSELMEDAGAEEVFFSGFDHDGSRKYLPNTLENVSRHMRTQGMVNAYNNGGLSATRSHLLKRMNTLAAIRKNKDLLKGREKYDEVFKEMENKLFMVISQLADMQEISSNKFINIDYAEARLQEAITKRNPVSYLNSEYGYQIAKDGEFAQSLSEFIQEVKSMPSKYFEGKFERPVYLNEFAGAVVPKGTSKEIVDALEGSGLAVMEYERGDEVSRNKAIEELAEEVKEQVMFRKHNVKSIDARNYGMTEREANYAIDNATAFVTGKSRSDARDIRLQREDERKARAKELYDAVLSGDFNDVTLQLIDNYISDVTPRNPYGNRISQRVPQAVERTTYGGKRTGAVDLLFSRISESAVAASERASKAGRRAVEEKKKELLKGWAIATGNWHTDLSAFVADETPFDNGKDSDVFYSQEDGYVIKASKGKPIEKGFPVDLDNIPLFNYYFPNTAYEILGYGELEGAFVRILRQPLVPFADAASVSVDERVSHMASMGFRPLNKAKTAFTNDDFVVADLQKANIVRDDEGNVAIIDADMKLHTTDVGGNYSYPDVEEDVSFRVFGGNSGYVGYSKSKRAVASEERGLRNASQMNAEFAKEVNSIIEERTGKPSKLTLKAIKAALPDIKADEWHHTSKFGNKTNYYSAEGVASHFAKDPAEEARESAAREDAKRRDAYAVAVRERIPTMKLETALGERDAFITSEGYAVEVPNNVIYNPGSARLYAIGELMGAAPYVVDSTSDWVFSNRDAYDDAVREYVRAVEKAMAEVDAEEEVNFKRVTDPKKVAELEAVNARFNAELQQQIDGTLPTGHIYQLGMPGEILRSTGIADAPIQLNSQRLMDKSSKFGHNFDLSEVKDLVRAINNPIAIFRYGDKTKAQNVVVEIQHGGKNFIVGISIRPVVGGNVLDINSIRNVFPKDNAEWLNWITEDKALYLNKEKIQDLIDQQRTNLADVEYLDLDDVANILESFENPQIPGVKNDEEEVLFRNGDPEIHERALARDRYERRVKTGMFQSQEALQDSMLGLKEAMQAILGKKTNIEDVDGFENAYLGENRLSSVNKAEADAFARLLFKPMLDEVAKLARNEAEREELTDYMMAKHGLERNAYMRNEAIKNGATDADQTDYAGLTALTGLDDVADAEAEAQRMVNDYEQAHETADLWEKVNAVSKAILQKSYECGMMSKETFDKVSDMYEFYIPLRGFDEKTSAEAYAYLSHKHSAFNAPIKKAEGRRSKADDPFANLQSMAEGAIMQGNRNKLVKQRFLNFALNHPSDLVSVSDIWVEYDAVTDEWKPVFPDNIESTDTPEEVEQKMQDFETKMESLAQQHPDQYKRGKDAIGIPYRIVESRDMRQHQVVVKRGGRDYVITINGNPRAAQALNGQTNPDNDMSGAIGAILRAGEKINRQLSAFYTTRNPDFIVSNFMRDMLYTNSMAWIKESPNYALRFHRNYLMVNPVTMKRLLAKYRKGTLDMSNKTEAMFHQFMMNGGETGYANIRDIEQHKNDIRKELKRANGKLKLARAWSLLAEKFDELNRAVENCARFAAFVTSREMGRSIDRAIYDAKEISVNFNKKGSGAKFYDSVGQTKAGNASALVSGLGRSGYVFWNAAIQGTTNFGRQMKRHPAKAFTGMAAMFLLGAIVAYFGGDDDEDDKNAYYNLPEYVRRSNILFRAGDSWISIPLPIEYRAFYGMGELMTSVFNGKEHLTGGEIAEAVLGQATQILPIDFLEGGGGLNAFVPSAAKPLWEAYVAEKSWTGMPLYKDTPFNKDMPEWTKAYSSTNKHIVNLAATLNEATGGDAYTKGAIDINPAKVEYMLNGYFGGVFGTIDKLTKTAETIVGDREYDPRSILLVNRLVKAGDERTEYRAINNRYYKVVEEAENTKRRLKVYEKDTRAGIFDYAEKIDFLYNSPEFERMQIYELHRKYIKALNDALKDAKMDGNEEASKDIEMELLNTKKLMLEQMEPSYDRK